MNKKPKRVLDMANETGANSHPSQKFWEKVVGPKWPKIAEIQLLKMMISYKVYFKYKTPIQ